MAYYAQIVGNRLISSGKEEKEEVFLEVGPFKESESAEKCLFLLVNNLKTYTESFKRPTAIKLVER